MRSWPPREGAVAKTDNRKSDLSVISSFAHERDASGGPMSAERERNPEIRREYDLKEQFIAGPVQLEDQIGGKVWNEG